MHDKLYTCWWRNTKKYIYIYIKGKNILWGKTKRKPWKSEKKKLKTVRSDY